MLEVDAIRSPDYWKNHDGPYGPRAGADYPCLVCGRGCASSAPHVHLHGGGTLIVTSEEAAQLDAEGWGGEDMGAYPVGRDCLRRHPELRPYVIAAPSGPG